MLASISNFCFWQIGKDHDTSNLVCNGHLAFYMADRSLDLFLFLEQTQNSGNPTLRCFSNIWTKHNYRWPTL